MGPAFEHLISATLEPWYPRIRLIVGRQHLSFVHRDRMFVTKAVLYIHEERIVAVGEPPDSGQWSERADVLDGKVETKVLLTKVIGHGVVQVLRRRLFLRPVYHVNFEPSATVTSRDYWTDVMRGCLAQRVEF